MACLKSILFVALLLAAVSAALTFPTLTSDAHNIYQCPDPSLAQVKIFDKTVHEAGEFQTVLQDYIEFPSNGEMNDQIITCIQVINLVQNGSGGFPTITEGGLNDYQITVILRSQPSEGLDFRIILWTAATTTTEMSTTEGC